MSSFQQFIHVAPVGMHLLCKPSDTPSFAFKQIFNKMPKMNVFLLTFHIHSSVKRQKIAWKYIFVRTLGFHTIQSDKKFHAVKTAHHLLSPIGFAIFYEGICGNLCSRIADNAFFTL